MVLALTDNRFKGFPFRQGVLFCASFFTVSSSQIKLSLQLIRHYTKVIPFTTEAVIIKKPVIDLHRKSMDWCLYGNGRRHKRVNGMLRRNIDHFLKKRKYEKLGFSEMN